MALRWAWVLVLALGSGTVALAQEGESHPLPVLPPDEPLPPRSTWDTPLAPGEDPWSLDGPGLDLPRRPLPRRPQETAPASRVAGLTLAGALGGMDLLLAALVPVSLVGGAWVTLVVGGALTYLLVPLLAVPTLYLLAVAALWCVLGMGLSVAWIMAAGAGPVAAWLASPGAAVLAYVATVKHARRRVPFLKFLGAVAPAGVLAVGAGVGAQWLAWSAGATLLSLAVRDSLSNAPANRDGRTAGGCCLGSLLCLGGAVVVMPLAAAGHALEVVAGTLAAGSLGRDREPAERARVDLLDVPEPEERSTPSAAGGG